VKHVEDKKEIERSAQEIVDSFVKATEELPETKETYYLQASYNITRPDGPPEKKGEEFFKRFKKLMPGSDEDGNLRVEVARWAKGR
jgi:hypothetical protein